MPWYSEPVSVAPDLGCACAPSVPTEGGVGAMLIWVIVAVIPIALLGSFLLASNGRARRRNRATEVWSQTEIDYKTRHDLIPKLEETLRGYVFRPRQAFRASATGGTNAVEQSRSDL